MKIAVVTICTRECETYGNLFINQLTDYCNRCGYHLHVVREDPEKPYGRHVHFGRYRVVREIIDEFDWVFWTDVDCFMENPEVRLESFIDDDAELVIGNDTMSINSGHWLMKNCDASKSLLDKMMIAEPLEHRMVDQPVLIKIIADDPWAIRWRMNGDMMNGNHTQSGNFFLRHLYGECDSYRVAYFDRRLSQLAEWIVSIFGTKRGKYIEVIDDTSLLDGLLRRGWRGVLNISSKKTFHPWWNAYHGWGHFSVGRPQSGKAYDVIVIHSGAMHCGPYREFLSSAKLMVVVGSGNAVLDTMISESGFNSIERRIGNAICFSKNTH